MSRNSKGARNNKIAKDNSASRKAKPADAPPQNPPRKANLTKRNAWWQKFRSYAESIKGGKKPPREQRVEVQVDAGVAA